MLAQILPKSVGGELPPEEGVKGPDAATSSIDRNVTKAPPESRESHEPEQEKIAQQAPVLSADDSVTENGAPQKVSALQEERPTPKRGHGGAMPR